MSADLLNFQRDAAERAPDRGPAVVFTRQDVGRGWQHMLTIFLIGRNLRRRQLTTGPKPSCSCRYGLFRVAGAPGPWIFTHRPGIRRPEALTAAFRIDPACAHHGEGR